MKITRQQLRHLIREELELTLEAGDDDKLSNADLIKGLKSGASDIASAIPAKLNDDFAAAMKGLQAMAQFDKGKFDKVKGLIDQYAETALKKAEKAG